MSDRPHGKHVIIDADNPEALGICDYSGFVFKHSDLVQQMEWRGNALVWTGFLVGRPYVDEPNEQLRPPILPPDPIPVLMPRTQQPTTVVWSNIATPWSLLVVYDWVSWSGSEDGVIVASEDARLAALQIGVTPTMVYSGSAANQPPEYTQAQILQQLQNFHWSA